MVEESDSGICNGEGEDSGIDMFAQGGSDLDSSRAVSGIEGLMGTDVIEGVRRAGGGGGDF